MTNKFNVGDKVMGVGSIRHNNDEPFFGEVTEVKRDEGSYYYEIRGKYPIPNKYVDDGSQCIWAWEESLMPYDNDKCVHAFIISAEINKLENGLRKLRKKIKTIITPQK